MNLVFCNKEGNPFDADALVRRQFAPALSRAKLRKIRFHDLRHTNVALCIAEGQNIKYIQYQLGHSSIQTTLDYYGHLLSDANQEQTKGLDNRLGISVKKMSLLEDC
jgi:integrase